MKKSLNASVPLRRRWDPPGEWQPLIHRNEYNDAFFYHGSHGALAAVRWRVPKPNADVYLERDSRRDSSIGNGVRLIAAKYRRTTGDSA